MMSFREFAESYADYLKAKQGTGLDEPITATPVYDPYRKEKPRSGEREASPLHQQYLRYKAQSRGLDNAGRATRQYNPNQAPWADPSYVPERFRNQSNPSFQKYLAMRQGSGLDQDVELRNYDPGPYTRRYARPDDLNLDQPQKVIGRTYDPQEPARGPFNKLLTRSLHGTEQPNKPLKSNKTTLGRTQPEDYPTQGPQGDTKAIGGHDNWKNYNWRGRK